MSLYGPLVYGWCRRAGLQEQDAADVGQEVFLAVSKAIDGYHHDQQGDSFRGWLRTITTNKIRDLARNRPAEGPGVGGSDAQKRLVEALADDDPSSAEADRSLLLHQAIEGFLVGCKEETRQAFLRVVVDRQSPQDVARDLNLTVNAVYLIRSRILRQLRDEFTGLLDLD